MKHEVARRVSACVHAAALSWGLLLVGCQQLSRLDDLSLATSSSSSGGGDETCSDCDGGTCVMGHCCRSGGGFAVHPFAGGLEAIRFAFAQLDGSGPLELLAVNQYSSDLMVYDLDPVGPSASLRQLLATGRGPSRPSTGDVDSDGIPDLVLALSETINLEPLNQIDVYRGNAEGRFDTPPQSFPQSGRPRNQVLADLDGNGDVDLFIQTDDCFLIRWGAGDGTFGEPECMATELLPILVETVRGPSGTPDAFLALREDSLYLVRWVMGVGLIRTRLDFGSEAISGGGVADIDGDGDDDILALTKGTSAHPNTVLTALREGDTVAVCDSLSAPQGVETMANPQLGDFDGDRLPDLLATDQHDETYATSDDLYYQSVNYLFRGVR